MRCLLSRSRALAAHFCPPGTTAQRVYGMPPPDGYSTVSPGIPMPFWPSRRRPTVLPRLTGSADGTARLWDLRQGNEVRARGSARRTGCRCCLRSGRQACCHGQPRWRRAHLASVVGQPAPPVATTQRNCFGDCVCAGGPARPFRRRRPKCLPCGRQLRAGGAPLQRPRQRCGEGRFFPDGRRVLSGASRYRTPDRNVRSWDAASGAELFGRSTADDERVEAVAFSMDGEQALVSRGETGLQLWSLTSQTGVNP